MRGHKFTDSTMVHPTNSQFSRGISFFIWEFAYGGVNFGYEGSKGPTILEFWFVYSIF